MSLTLVNPRSIARTIDRFICYPHVLEEGLKCMKHGEFFQGFVGFGNACPRCVAEAAVRIEEDQAEVISGFFRRLPDADRKRIVRLCGRKIAPTTAVAGLLAKRVVCVGETADAVIERAMSANSALLVLPSNGRMMARQTSIDVDREMAEMFVS